MEEPLSIKLAQILEADEAAPLTINALIERTEGRGLYLVIILLSLPFIVPVSIPGVSTLLGLIIAVLSIRLALGLPPRLPKFMGERPLPPGMKRRLAGGGVKFLRMVEKMVRPRRTYWMTRRGARTGNSLLMALMACLLALPFPPLPPLTNSMPCYALILLAAAMMEDDGVLIWIAYAVALGAVAYLGFIVAALEKVVVKTYETLKQFFP